MSKKVIELEKFMRKYKYNIEMVASVLGMTQGGVRHWLNGIREIPEVSVRVILAFNSGLMTPEEFRELGE